MDGILSLHTGLRGFTLVELLVVMVLVGLLATIGLVTVGTGNQERELQNEVNRLHAVLRMAAEEAVYSNTEIGVTIDDHEYGFLSFNEEEAKWEEVTQSFLKTYALPDWIVMDLQREGDLQSLVSSNKEQSSQAPADDAESSVRPDFMLLSSAEVTPFIIGLEIDGNGDSRIEIKTDDQGEIILPALAELTE